MNFFSCLSSLYFDTDLSVCKKNVECVDTRIFLDRIPTTFMHVECNIPDNFIQQKLEIFEEEVSLT